MNLNESCGTDSFKLRGYFLSLKLTFKCVSYRDDMYVDIFRFRICIFTKASTSKQ